MPKSLLPNSSRAGKLLCHAYHRFDLQAAVEKTIKYINEAGDNGANVIAFPECWIPGSPAWKVLTPGYPLWIWEYPVNPPLLLQYIRNALSVDSSERKRICAAAREAQIYVVLGFAETEHDASLYMSQCIISPQGEIEMHRRKMKPTHVERSIFGEGSGNCLAN